MNFKRLSIFFILSLFISANVYADTMRTENKFNSQYNLNSQLLPEFGINSNDCESNTFTTNPIKHVHCSKLKHHKFAFAVPLIIGGTEIIVDVVVPAIIGTGIVVDSEIVSEVLKEDDTKKPCGPCKPPLPPVPGTKVYLEYHGSNSRPHFPCTKEEGHWHWKVILQDPSTCDCFRSKKKTKCGSIPPE